MKEMIKRIPIPLCGVMLAMAALGNLLQSHSEQLRSVCGVIAGILLLLVILKLVLFPKAIMEDLKDPIMASVSGTFSMALMLLSTYVKPFIGKAAYYIWLFAIVLHIVLILYFTVRFIVKLQMPKVFASYYIVYVGIAVAAITAPAYEKTGIGSAAFWSGFICLLALLVLVTVRYVRYKEIPDPAKPLICIYAAPVSLCAAGYVQSVTPKSCAMLTAMFIAASILYLFALIRAIGYMRLPFFPSYASFTFPFVISAIASKQTMACLADMGRPIPALRYAVLAETVIAVVFVSYTLIRFLQFILVGPKTE